MFGGQLRTLLTTSFRLYKGIPFQGKVCYVSILCLLHTRRHARFPLKLYSWSSTSRPSYEVDDHLLNLGIAFSPIARSADLNSGSW